jgi:hypothetical protein
MLFALLILGPCGIAAVLYVAWLVLQFTLGFVGAFELADRAPP